jgi:hypothetical protein
VSAPRIGPSEVHRRPTPQPGFDVAAFARESERRMRASVDAGEAGEKTSTAPPPPYHPASIPPPAPQPSRSTHAGLAVLDAPLREGHARTALARSELAAGRLSHEEALKVLRLEIAAVEVNARAVAAAPLASWLGQLGRTLDDILGPAMATGRKPMCVAVVDGDAIARQRIALALESLGHAARTFGALAELPRASRAEAPDAVFVVAELGGEHPATGFGEVVRELAHNEHASVVVYTSEARPDVATLARERGAHLAFCPASTFDGLMAQLAQMLDDMAW